MDGCDDRERERDRITYPRSRCSGDKLSIAAIHEPWPPLRTAAAQVVQTPFWHMQGGSPKASMAASSKEVPSETETVLVSPFRVMTTSQWLVGCWGAWMRVGELMEEGAWGDGGKGKNVPGRVELALQIRGDGNADVTSHMQAGAADHACGRGREKKACGQGGQQEQGGEAAHCGIGVEGVGCWVLGLCDVMGWWSRSSGVMMMGWEREEQDGLVGVRA